MTHKILVVDDEIDVRSLLVSVLQEAGYETAEVRDALNIVHVVESEQPDLVLLDLTMPEIDGFEALRRLKSSTSTESIPVIVASAQARKEVMLLARDGGAADFLIKPWEDGEVEWRVENVLKTSARRAA